MSFFKRGAPRARVDMLRGSIWDKLLLFSVPLAFSAVAQQLFNSVDAAVVGRFASKQALAAVGSCGNVIGLLINVFLGLSIGANVIISNYIGQGRGDKSSDAVHTSMVVGAMSGLFLAAAGIAVSRPILEFMSTPEDMMPDSLAYLRIYMLGMPFAMIYNFGAAILRSVGDTKRPLWCLIIAGLANVPLNVLFVVAFGFGAGGVAAATLASNVLAAWMITRILMRESDENIRLDLRRLRVTRAELGRIFYIGVPAGLQGTLFSISNICVQGAINKLGSAAAAGAAAALNYELYVYFVIASYAQAVVTFTSQNYGANLPDRCRRICAIGMAYAVATAMCESALFVMGRDTFISLFTLDPEVADYASQRLMRVVAFEFLAASYEVTSGAMRGLGSSITPTVITTFGIIVFRLAWVFVVFDRFPTFSALMSLYPVSWVLTGAMMIVAYFVVMRRAFAGMGGDKC